MNNVDLTTMLFSLIGRTFELDNREIQVLTLLSGPTDSQFLCIWKDTCMVFTAPIFDIALQFDSTLTPPIKS